MDKIDADKLTEKLSRRRIVQGVAGLTSLSLAGCQGLFGGGDGGDGQTGGDGTGDGTGGDGNTGTSTGGGGDGGPVERGPVGDPILDRVEVDPADIVEGGTFRAGLSEDVDTFDTPWSSSAEASAVQNLIYEGMIKVDSKGNIYPWLAESYEQVDVQAVERTDYEDYMITAGYTEDGVPDLDRQIVVSHPDNDPESGEGQFLTVEEAGDAVADGTYGMHFRFDLHEGMTFHDGEEITADNVVESYGRVRGSSLSGQLFDSLLDIEAEGDYTVHMYTQVPDAAAVRELAGWDVYPTAVTDLPPEANDPREGNDPLGSGPWVFESYKSEEFVTFTRNDDWWFSTDMKEWYDGPENFPDQPAVEKVDISFVSDDASRSAALTTGELDFTFGLSVTNLNNYAASEAYRTNRAKGAGFKFMSFPVNSEPWDDARLRRAVNQLIPRSQIANRIFSGWENPAWVPLPPLAAKDGTMDYDALVNNLKHYNTFDPQKARQLAQEVVDEKGLDTPIDVTIVTNSDNDDRVRTVELIAQSLNQLDVFNAKVETLEFLQFVIQLIGGQYADTQKLTFVGLSGGFGPHGYAKSIHHPDNWQQCCNVMNVDNDELNDLMYEARYGTDVAEDANLRRRRYEKVWEKVLDLNANSYTTHSINTGVVDADVVKGFNTNPSTQNIVDYGLYSPMEQQITYLER